MLLHVPDILDREQLMQLRAALDAADWTDGKATVGAQGAQVKQNLQLPDASTVRHALARVVLDALSRHAMYFAAALPARTFPPRFNRYTGGGHYGVHVDGAVMSMASEQDSPARQLRSDLSCTLFLSDPDEYDGGELVINDTYGAHEVKLPAGDLILYPAGSLHEVQPVTRGTRVASFFWVQSLVRDDAKRQLLFDLDASIQALTQSGAARDELVRLTGIYHNLLRGWAEP